MRKVLNWGVFVLVLLGAYLIAGPTSLGGTASYVIVDGSSMEPTYYDGDLVMTREQDTYGVGDIVVYDAPINSQFNVIHRITERTDGGFITQGDNRDEPDGWIAPDEEIYGAALFHIPNGGAIVNFLRQPTTILAIGAGWITLILMERPPKQSDRGGTGSSSFTGREKPGHTPQRRRRRSDTPASTVDDTAHTPRLSRTAKKAAERTERRKKRSTVGAVSLVLLLGGSGGVLFAHAAVLSVDAGVLQAFQQEVDIEPPPPSEFDITVHVHFFDSSDLGEEIGRSPFSFEPVEVKAGQFYQVTWNGPPGNSTVVDCTSDEITFYDELPEDTYEGIDEVSPEHDADHLLCIQTAPGNVPDNIEFEVFNGEGVEVELTPSDDEESEGDDVTGDQAQGDDGTDQDTSGDDTSKDDSEDTTATEETDEDSDGTDGEDSTTEETGESSDGTDSAADETDESSDGTDDVADDDTSSGESDDSEDRAVEDEPDGDGTVDEDEDDPEDGLADDAEDEGDPGEDD